MSYFLKSGNSFKVANEGALDIHKVLPVGNYLVKKDAFENLYLEQVDSFEFKGKKYGDNDRNRDRIFDTFVAREVSTGVLLTGEKGSGKTLLAKSLSMRCAEQGIPTILINCPWRGDAFNQLLQDISQPCMVLFDEFEKVYDDEQQEQMLTLLDGVFVSKKLFVLTCNDKWRVNTHMRNRPGRIFYMLDFKGLSQEFIQEYCEDSLKNQSHIESVCRIGSLFGEFNFDMLKALVEEMNRYDESPQDAMRMLNAKPEFDEGSPYFVSVTPEGKTEPLSDRELSEPSTWKGNPLSRESWNYNYDTDPDDDDSKWISMRFTQRDLKKVDPVEGKFLFVNPTGDTLVLTREKGAPKYNYNAF